MSDTFCRIADPVLEQAGLELADSEHLKSCLKCPFKPLVLCDSLPLMNRKYGFNEPSLFSL